MTVQRDPDAILAAWLDEGRLASSRRGGRSPSTPEPPPNDGVRFGCRGETRDEHLRPMGVALWRSSSRSAALHTSLRLAEPGRRHADPDHLIDGHTRSVQVSRPDRASPDSSAIAEPSILATEGFVYPGAYIPQFDPPLPSRSTVRSSTTARRTSSVAAASMPTCPMGRSRIRLAQDRNDDDPGRQDR
jgi:hypothetical protein